MRILPVKSSKHTLFMVLRLMPIMACMLLLRSTTSFAGNDNDIDGAVGTEVRPIANAVLYGTSISLAWPVVRNFYMGMVFDGADGSTKSTYGFPPSDKGRLHIANLGGGALFEYAIVNSGNTSLFVAMQGRLDFFFLGTPVLFATRSTVYRIKATNAAFSLSPGLELSTKHLFIEAHYNFVAAATTNFGEAADFEGPQFSFNYYYKDRRGRATSWHEQTRSRHRYRNSYSF